MQRLTALLLLLVSLPLAAQTSSTRTPILALEIGDDGGASDVVFQRIGPIGVGRDGRIYVADLLDKSIKVLTPAGKLISTFGGSGQGPGDFISISRITVGTNSVSIPDAMQRRVSEFTLDGKPIRTKTWASFSAGVPGQVLPLRDSVMLFASVGSMNSQGPDKSDPFVVVRIHRGTKVDTLLRLRTEIAFWHPKGQNIWNPIMSGFGEGGAWAVSGDSLVAVADGYTGVVRWYGIDAGNTRLQRTAQIGLTAQPVTPEEIAGLDAIFRESHPTPAYARMAIEIAAPPTRWSVASGAVFADDGALWIASAARKGAPVTWSVFAAGATNPTLVKLPVGFTLKAVSGGRLYGTASTTSDVPVVRVYTLR